MIPYWEGSQSVRLLSRRSLCTAVIAVDSPSGDTATFGGGGGGVCCKTDRLDNNLVVFFVSEFQINACVENIETTHITTDTSNIKRTYKLVLE